MTESDHPGLLAQIVAEALTKDARKKNTVFNLAQRLTRRGTDLAQTRAKVQGICPCFGDDVVESPVTRVAPKTVPLVQNDERTWKSIEEYRFKLRA